MNFLRAVYCDPTSTAFMLRFIKLASSCNKDFICIYWLKFLEPLHYRGRNKLR